MTNKCRKCSTLLVVGENVTQWQVDHSQYICRRCTSEYQCERNHRAGRSQPMDTNKSCTLFLGVHIAERVLSHIFKDVERMPNGNPGYDFICGRGYKIDVKSSCRYHSGNIADRWKFNIKKNQIADYFLCLTFDNRELLNPEYVWLVPAVEINDHETISISESCVDKWEEYKHDINRVTACCNTLRGQ